MPMRGRSAGRKAWAVLQGMAMKAAPAASSRRAPVVRAGRGSGPFPCKKAERSGTLGLDGAHRSPDAAIARLAELPGIGPWTAQYMAMRALRWPDAFPKEDIAVRNNLGGITPKEADALSQAWRPWRSYAVMHIWRMTPLVASHMRYAGGE